MERINMSEWEHEEFLENVEKNRWQETLRTIGRDWRLYVMLLPLVLVFIFWRYVPMTGLLIGFKKFEVRLGVWGSPFEGFKNFREIMFGSQAVSGEFWRAFRNTFLLSFYGLIFGFPIPIILALFFSEIKSDRYRSLIQIFSYLPRFISTVIITTIIALLLKHPDAVSPSEGILSQLLVRIGLVPEQTKIMLTPKYFRPVFVVSGIWETAGYGSIIYFAAIMSISPTSYEAARIDGATKGQQIRHVTLPGIASTLIIMLILKIGDLMAIGYEKVLLLYSSSIYETADVLSTFIYRRGFGLGSNPSIAASADLFNSLIAMFLVVGANFIARRVSNTSLY